MIQAVMLIALGFLVASLIAILLAPSLWSRAYRLSKKRIESSLPLSLTEIEAAQDQLRASYAVRMRRLETSLAGAKQKAAAQLVDNSHLQMQIATLRDQISALDLQLAERTNAAHVLQVAVTQRVPDLEREILGLNAELKDRLQEVQDLATKLARRDESLGVARKTATTVQTELTKLRQAMEKTGADKGGRLLRRPTQWSLEDYRSEYDRLNLELSKMRQDVSRLQERDTHQGGLIKGELQKITELLLSTTHAKAGAQASETAAATPLVKRAAPTDFRMDRPRPWTQRTETVLDTKPLEKPANGKDDKKDDKAVAQVAANEEAAKPIDVQVQAEADNKTQAEVSKASSTVLSSKQAQSAFTAASRHRLLNEIAAATGVQSASASPSVSAPEDSTFEDPSAILPEHYQEEAAHSASAEERDSNSSKAPPPPEVTAASSDDKQKAALSSARDLRAISELFAINAANQPEEKPASENNTALAEEAQNGHVIEVNSVEADGSKSQMEAASDTQNGPASMSLMNRLRALSDGGAKAEKQ